jgi:hypothetical protein
MGKFLLLAFLWIAQMASAQQMEGPTWFQAAFKKDGLDKKYTILPYIKTGHLQADFNGDGWKDVAVLITENISKKRGILIFHNRTYQYFILGAGNKFGNGGDDFKWAKVWKLYHKQKVVETQFDKDDSIIGEKTINIKRIGISIWAIEDGAPIAGAVIYWNGRKYTWIHQGE